MPMAIKNHKKCDGLLEMLCPLSPSWNHKICLWIMTSAETLPNYYFVVHSCLTLCKPMDCSTPGFPVLHYLLEFAQTHVHWVNDTIQAFHPLLSPSLPALSTSESFPVSQLFASSGQSIGATALVLLMNIQGRFPLGLTGLISLPIYSL